MHNVEKQLEQYGKKILVNHELKGELRLRFNKRGKKNKGWLYLCMVAASLTIILVAQTLLDNAPQHVVRAAKLEISAQYSFIDLTTGQHGAPAVHKEQLYLPLYGKGVYLLDSTAVRSGEGLSQIVDNTNVISTVISHSGDKLAFGTDKGLYILDLTTQTVETLVEGNGYDIYYEHPSWTPGDETLLVTKRMVTWKEHGFELKSEEVIEITVKDKQMKKITEGSFASMSPDQTYIVFTRDGEVHVKRKGQERRLGTGQHPAISPDGQYIAYVREDEVKRQLTEKATVRESISNVYVASAANFEDERKLTANYPLHFRDEIEWAQGVTSEEVLEFNGFYSYYTPVWGSDSQHVFVLKNGQGSSRLMRIDLAQGYSNPFTEASMTILAFQYLDALVNRDTDTAERIYSTSRVETSNPHPIGFSIMGSGAIEGREYIDAKQFVAYEGEPYYQIRELRFYFSRDTRGYTVEEIVQRDSKEVFVRGADVIYADSVILTVEPAVKLGALVLDTASNTLYYTVEGKDSSQIRALSLHTGETKHVFALTGRVSSLSVNEREVSEEGFLVINFNDSDHQQRGMLFSLLWNMPVQTLGRTNRVFFAGSRLLCYTENAGEMVRWEYEPISGTSKLWP